MTNFATRPARYERETQSSDGVKLAWLDYGPSEGPVVVLCHGLAAGADQFDADAQFFAAKGFRVIVPDLRGHGRSGRADVTDPLAYSIARMARDIVDIFAAAGIEKADYVGNSLGGIIALYLLPRHSNLFCSVATFGTAPRLALPGIVSRILPLSYKVMGKNLTGWVTAQATTPDVQGRAMVKKLVADFDPAVGAAISRAIRVYDLTENALGAKIPFLIVRGDKDKAVNRMLDPVLDKLAARPNIDIVRLEHAGHCANLDQPSALRKALEDFWSANALSGR